MKPHRLTAQFAVRLDAQTADLVRALAVAEDRSPSAVIRRAIQRDLFARAHNERRAARESDPSAIPSS